MHVLNVTEIRPHKGRGIVIALDLDGTKNLNVIDNVYSTKEKEKSILEQHHKASYWEWNRNSQLALGDMSTKTAYALTKIQILSKPYDKL